MVCPRSTATGRGAALVLTLIALACQAADPSAALPDELPSELDALSLADEARAEPDKPERRWRLWVEGAAGRVESAGRHYDTQRLSIDLRVNGTLAPGLRGVLSDRLDLVKGGSADNANTLREAYLSWAAGPNWTLDLGRVNIRHGAAMGYNPTDWFREGALRAVASPDPAVLRENRQGTVALQAHRVWDGGAATVALSPRLVGSAASHPDPDTFALDEGRTNPRHRWQITGSQRLAERFTPQFVLHGGSGRPTQLGANLSALAGEATVLFAEMTSGKGDTLASQALGLGHPERSLRRVAAGMTFATPFDLTLTAEVEYNGAGVSKAQFDALAPSARLALLALADYLQDLPARNAWFIHATWNNALMPRLDLSGYVRIDTETRSRDQWFEARYRWDDADLALQWQGFSGSPHSIYGTVPQRRAVEVAARFYF